MCIFDVLLKVLDSHYDFSVLAMPVMVFRKKRSSDTEVGEPYPVFLLKFVNFGVFAKL